MPEMDYTASIDVYEYDPINFIGVTLFGVVYEGRSKRDHSRKVAVKRVGAEISDARKQQLINDITVLKNISHDHIVQIVSFNLETNMLYLITDLCNGGDLSKYLDIKGAINENVVQILLKHMSSALTYLREKNVVHRDLRPPNILLHYPTEGHDKNFADLYERLANEISFKIVDFGLAKVIESGRGTQTECIPEFYRAPEVFSNLHHDMQVDVWSLGIVTLQCLYGYHPLLQGLDYGNACIDVRYQFPIPDSASNELKNLIRKMLQHDPSRRITAPDMERDPFITAGEVLDEFPPATSEMRSEANKIDADAQSILLCNQQGDVDWTAKDELWMRMLEGEGWYSRLIILPAALRGLKVWMVVDKMNEEIVVWCYMEDDSYNKALLSSFKAHISFQVKNIRTAEVIAHDLKNVEWKHLGDRVQLCRFLPRKLDGFTPPKFNFQFTPFRGNE